MAKGPGSLLGQTLGQFAIKEELGRGGMAVVYKGYQQSLDRWVAIKTLPIELAADREMVSRFHREAEAMVSLNHTNIVQIIDKGEDKGCYYFAMEFVAGPSLKDMLKESELSIDLLFEVSIQVCEGLGYAHKKGIIHRDIKPANILWETGTSLAKVADFGIARVNNKELEMITLTANNVGMGTMNYMSPEQKTDAKAVDHRADIYSLGVMIYEMFTGKLPLGKFKMPAELNPKLPKKLDEVLSKCLETDPADRWQTMDELRAGLTEARAQAKGGTLVRSVRDAAERTLTAMKGGGGGGKVVAGLLGCTVLLGGLGALGFVVKKYAIDPKVAVATDTGTSSPGTDTGTKPPATDTGAKPPSTDTGTKPPNPGTGTKPPGTDTGTKPPNPGTGTKPPTDTGTKPPTDTGTKPPTDTGTKPPTDTGTKPPTDTGTKPPTDTGTKPPPTETGPSPTTAELSLADAKKFDDARGKLDALVSNVRDEARRAGISGALAAALGAAATTLEGADRLRSDGKVAAIQRCQEGQQELQGAAAAAFVDAARQRIAEATAMAGPGKTAEAKRDFDAAAAKRPEEQFAVYADSLVKSRVALVDALSRSTRVLVAMAAVRGAEGPALTEVQKGLADAEAIEQTRPDEAIALYRTTREKALAVRGPTVSRLKALAKVSVKSVCPDGFYSIAPAPARRILGIGPSGAEDVLVCVFEVRDGNLVAVGLPLSVVDRATKFQKPRFVAPAGPRSAWVANLKTIRRIDLETGEWDPEVEDLQIEDSPIFDIEAAPDGSLLVAATRGVSVVDARTHQARLVGTLGSPPISPFFEVPRRMVGLPGGGWVLSGETAFGGAAPAPEQRKAGLQAVWDAEASGWDVLLRMSSAGRGSPGQVHPRNIKALAIGLAGDRVLTVAHDMDGGAFHLLPADLTPAPGPALGIDASGPMLAQLPRGATDLAVTGKYAAVLHWRDKNMDADVRVFVSLYELVP